MQDSQPSHTAWRVAARRAAHQLLDRPVVFDDPLAVTVLGPDEARALRTGPASSEAGQIGRMLRAFLAVRSRIAEDTLRGLVGDGLTQYVVLGAGLDTFAYRNPHPGLRVWEVDHPATQAWKRACLRRAGIAEPDPSPFVAVDLAREPLGPALERAGVDPAQPTFFSWLGVIVYVPELAVRRTLGEVASFARGGGGVVFDYAVPPDSLGPVSRAAFEVMAERVQAVDEPWVTFFEAPVLGGLLERLGFANVEDLSGPQLNERYFGQRADGLRVGTLGHVVRALTAGPTGATLSAADSR